MLYQQDRIEVKQSATVRQLNLVFHYLVNLLRFSMESIKFWTDISLGTSQLKALHISFLNASDLSKASANDLRTDLGHAAQSNPTCCVTAFDPRGRCMTNWLDEHLG
jgi:hypothetical protein